LPKEKVAVQTLKDKVENYYSTNNWQQAAFQKQTLNKCLAGKSGLVNAPTGSGKTNALLMPILMEGIRQNHTKGLFAIWITPLRALAKEIELATQRLIDFYNLDWKVAQRSGDTSQADRQKIYKSPPQILITTPESLHLILAKKDNSKFFKNLNYLVVDEWHELIGSKRGVMIELALSRLRTVCPKLKTWGISATIGNLDQAMEVLLGSEYQNGVFLKAAIKKKITVESIIPDEMDIYPWSGHLGIKLLPQILPILRKSKSTLIFTNTRAQAEIWYQQLIDQAPDLIGLVAMHHGSIGKELRTWVEDALHEGKLKAVVCTSSLDLGVDFRPVDTVIQVGGPKGVARFLQRAGRSGHAPGEKSKIYFLPTHALELMEASALREAAKTHKVEARIPYVKCFDVLIQYLVTLAVSDGFKPTQIFEEVKQTYCFAQLTEEEFSFCLNFIVNGGETLTSYDEFKKVIINEEGIYKVESRKVAMRHRMHIGTIVSDAVLQVKYLKGGYIGTIEEYFISKLKVGDTFWFAGRNLEFVNIKEMVVRVRNSKGKTGKIPAWAGGRLPLSSQLAEGVRKQFSAFLENKTLTNEFTALEELMETQQKASVIPTENQLLIETTKTRDGYHLFAYPFEGRFVNEALASLLAYRLSILSPITFTIAINDYGFELLSDQAIDVEAIFDNDLFSEEYLMDDLKEALNATEMARRKFRDIAVISGLVFQGMPGKYKKQKHLQASSQLFFNVFKEYDENNLLLQQSYTEAFEFQLEENRLKNALKRINKQEIVIKTVRKPTPLSFPILVDRMREKLTSENLEDRIKKMQLSLAKL